MTYASVRSRRRRSKIHFHQNVGKEILGKVTRVGVHIIFRLQVLGYNVPLRVILTPPVRIGLKPDWKAGLESWKSLTHPENS